MAVNLHAFETHACTASLPPILAAALTLRLRQHPTPPPHPPRSLSMGGMVAQTIALKHPNAVRAVVSVASSYGGRAAPQPEGGIDAMLK